MKEDRPLSVDLVFYLADEHEEGDLRFSDKKSAESIVLEGHNRVNGDYSMRIEGTAKLEQRLLLSVPKDLIWDGSSLLQELIQTHRIDHTMLAKDAGIRENFSAAIFHVQEDSEIKVAYRKGGALPNFSINDAQRIRAFKRRFTKTFGHVHPASRPACQFAISNLLGSISYFYGTSFVLNETEIESTVVETPPFELFSDIPSRATFPRGFLWDSGFHNLIISEWDPKLSLEILESWANRIEHNGWAAREQVPGNEARRAVPVEYIIQNTKHANPPALLMTLLKLAKHARSTKNKKERNFIVHKLHHIVPQFEKNLKWLIRTQRGQIHPHFCRLMSDTIPCKRVLKLPAFRWRGRSKYHNLNSGLDDYPRGSFANRFELHVDLACWVAYGAKTMLELYELLEVKGGWKQRRRFQKIYRRVRFSLERLHWDEERKLYSDLTITEDGDMQYVPHKGYVNLFPLLFGFIDKNSTKFKSTLDLIEDPEHLWTDFGLRSLSRSDPYYMKGDKYWTGPIWININYLVLAALKNHYMNPRGAHYDQAKRIYENLRGNIIKNMSKSFSTTGTIWEQYSDINGSGMRSRPFTGWSALLVLIAAERY